MKLTDAKIRNATPREKPYKLYDGRGMYLQVPPRGNKRWRLKYRYEKREKSISLGVYPEVGLKAARDNCTEARELLAKGIDPSSAKAAGKAAGIDTFEFVAREWYAKFNPTWASSHAQTIIRRLEKDIFPWIGSRPIRDVAAREILSVVRRVESRGALETAHRERSICGQIFRYAIATGRAERDPAADLRGALPPVKPQHHPSITDPHAIGGLMRAIDGYDGTFVTKCALQLAPLTFVRPGELRHAEWQEFDLDSREWRIPAEKMKRNRVHIVPLSRQAIAVLKELQPLTGAGKYLFPGLRSAHRPMSENTINAALRRMGYASNEMTGHGFRSMASTLLNEQGWPVDAIELQLAHTDGNKVRAAYNYAELLPKRREMMQAWADYLDSLKLKTIPSAPHKAYEFPDAEV